MQLLYECFVIFGLGFFPFAMIYIIAAFQKKKRTSAPQDISFDLGFFKMGPNRSRPEVKQSAVYGEFPEKYDVFSFGVVLFGVLCGRTLMLPKHQLIDWLVNL